MSRRARINLLLGLACLLAGHAVYAAVVRPSAELPAPPEQTVAPDPLKVRFTPPDYRQLNEISRRPLFDPARRPERPAAVTKAPAVAPPAVRMTGVIATGQTARVMLQVNGTGGIFRTGDDIAGWRLDRIDAAAVTLSREGIRHVVAMGDDPVGAPDGQSPRATARPAANIPADMTEMIDE